MFQFIALIRKKKTSYYCRLGYLNSLNYPCFLFLPWSCQNLVLFLSFEKVRYLHLNVSILARLFILSGSVSTCFSSNILGTYQPGEFMFQCHIFLLFYTVHGVLKVRLLKWFAIPFSSGPHFVRTLRHDHVLSENINIKIMSRIQCWDHV